MKTRFVESQLALNHVALALSTYCPCDHAEQFKRLRELRAMVKVLRIAFDDTEHMPCGYQDAAGERLDHAARDLCAYLDAMAISRGRYSRRFLAAVQRAGMAE